MLDLAKTCMKLKLSFYEFLGARIDYYVFVENAEIARFQMEVTEWEQAEDFDIFWR